MPADVHNIISNLKELFFFFLISFVLSCVCVYIHYVFPFAESIIAYFFDIQHVILDSLFLFILDTPGRFS